MKKTLFILLFVISEIASAGGIIRKELNLTASKLANDPLRRISVKYGNGQEIMLPVYYHENNSDSVILIIDIDSSQSESKYFEAITYVIKSFLKNYKIESVNKKYIVFWLPNNQEKYTHRYKVSVNNLKLLNNRDFGVKDFSSFNAKEGIIFYPLKVILRKGTFISHDGSSTNEAIKERYSDFLKNYDISPIIEGSIEAWYEKIKTK